MDVWVKIGWRQRSDRRSGTSRAVQRCGDGKRTVAEQVSNSVSRGRSVSLKMMLGDENCNEGG